jgi:hypothetical protein
MGDQCSSTYRLLDKANIIDQLSAWSINAAALTICCVRWQTALVSLQHRALMQQHSPSVGQGGQQWSAFSMGKQCSGTNHLLEEDADSTGQHHHGGLMQGQSPPVRSGGRWRWSDISMGINVVALTICWTRRQTALVSFQHRGSMQQHLPTVG